MSRRSLSASVLALAWLVAASQVAAAQHGRRELLATGGWADCPPPTTGSYFKNASFLAHIFGGAAAATCCEWCQVYTVTLGIPCGGWAASASDALCALYHPGTDMTLVPSPIFANWTLGLPPLNSSSNASGSGSNVTASSSNTTTSGSGSGSGSAGDGTLPAHAVAALPTNPDAALPDASMGAAPQPVNVAALDTAWVLRQNETSCLQYDAAQRNWTDDGRWWGVPPSKSPTVDTAEVERRAADLCSRPDTAGSDIAQALAGGGEGARLALLAFASVEPCPNGASLAMLFLDFVNPAGNTDLQRVLRHAQEWVDAAASLGTAGCYSVATFDPLGRLLEQRQVHPPDAADTPAGNTTARGSGGASGSRGGSIGKARLLRQQPVVTP